MTTFDSIFITFLTLIGVGIFAATIWLVIKYKNGENKK